MLTTKTIHCFMPYHFSKLSPVSSSFSPLSLCSLSMVLSVLQIWNFQLCPIFYLSFAQSSPILKKFEFFQFLQVFPPFIHCLLVIQPVNQSLSFFPHHLFPCQYRYIYFFLLPDFLFIFLSLPSNHTTFTSSDFPLAELLAF